MVIALRILRGLTSVLVLGLLVSGRMASMHWNLLMVLGIVALPVRFIGLAIDALRKELTPPWRWEGEGRRGRVLHALVQGTGPLIGAVAILVAIVPAQVGEDLKMAQAVTVGVALAWAGLAWFQRTTPRWGLTVVSLAIGLMFGADLLLIGAGAGEGVPLTAPLDGPGLVLQGGPTPLLNHHRSIAQQADAIDVLIARNGKFTDGPAEDLDSYGCWGTAVLAPAAGTVVRKVDGLADNAIGETDTVNLAGNHVVVELDPEHFVMLAHLQNGSTRVEVGDRVTAGQPLARCGNSGNTSAPHLHLQVMNKPDFSVTDEALHTWPAMFSVVRRDGESAARVPRRNDELLPEG